MRRFNLLGLALMLAPGTHPIDTAHSVASFNITNFLLVRVDGDFTKIRGELKKGITFADSEVTAQIEVASIDTKSKMRDRHLLSADFFDAPKFPTMTFQSKSISGNESDFKMTGPLTIKGITHEVTFEGSTDRDDPHLLVAETKIDRKDYAITEGSTIKDEVRLKVTIKLLDSGSQNPNSLNSKTQ